MLATAGFNLASAFAPWFSMLLALRFVGGMSLAIMTWLGRQEVFGDDDRMGDVPRSVVPVQ